MQRVAVLLLTALLGGTSAVAQQKLDFVVEPYLQNVTRNGITVMWETNVPSSSAVEFGLSARFGHQVQNDAFVKIHEVRLDGLEPQTTYFYRVVSRDRAGTTLASDTLSFQTAVLPNTAFAFGVVGDSRTYPDRWHKIADLVWAERPNFVLHVGDVVTNGDVKEQWVREFLVPAATLFGRVPFFVAIGNHERNAHWFYDYMSNPPPENYYTFRYGNAEFIVVDTNDRKGLQPGGEQYRWLVKALESSKATWKFVAHHHPPYSSDENDYGDAYRGPTTLGDPEVRQLVPLYEKYGVDIVWVGHIHTYERTWPIRKGRVDEKHGVIYIQAGGGGAELEDFAPTRSWFTAKLLRDWQYCLVTIHGHTLVMMAYDIDGRLYDYLKLQK